MSTGLTQRLVRVGDLVAEMDIAIEEDEGGWRRISPLLTPIGSTTCVMRFGSAMSRRQHASPTGCIASRPSKPDTTSTERWLDARPAG